MAPATLAWAVGGLLLASGCRAAGGHHAIDDAVLVEPGRCQVETWVERGSSGQRRLVHIGPACRLGWVEAALNLDHGHIEAGADVTAYGPQLKWARAWGERTSVGAVWSATWQDHSPRLLGHTIVLPLTWQAGDSLVVHLNAGRDFVSGAPDATRAGAALEWTPSAAWSFVGEQFRTGGRDHWRAGARYTFDFALSVDFSHARTFGDATSAWWAVGLTWLFDR